MNEFCNAKVTGSGLTRMKMLAIHESIRRMKLAGGEQLGTHALQGEMLEAMAEPANPKPWRTNTKRCCREKTRRVHAQLDKHAFVYQ